MALPSLRSLLEVGAHFGHRKEHSHPASRRFIYTVKDGVFVINVEKTLEYLEAALKFLRGVLKDGGTVLFVGTKSQAKGAVRQAAIKLGQPYVVSRWLGGTLTNFDTIKRSLFQPQELEKKINDPGFETLPKRERTHTREKQAKLTQVFEGILKLTKMPDVLFVVDAAHEDIAILEANKLGIPVVALMDTNADPQLIGYPIPANDESKRAVELLMGVVADELSDVKVREKASGPTGQEARREEKPSAPEQKEEKHTEKPRAEKPIKAKPAKTAKARKTKKKE